MSPALLKKYPAAERLARKLVSLYPYSSRLGPVFWNWYAFLEDSQGWSAEQLRAYQFEQLRSLLKRLATTSLFYAKRLAEVPIQDLESLADLQQHVAPLTRQEFAANYNDIRCRDFQKRPVLPCSTSGTTGNALEFFHAVENRKREWASICHQWKRVGYDPARSRRAEFRGLTRQGYLFDDFPDQNMVRFSILDIRAETLPRMADKVQSARLDFFHGYPSALYLLASEVLKSGIRFPEPKAFLLASEMVYDFQLEQIQAAFPNARLFAHYGCAECTVLAGWCEKRRVYHVLPQYSLVEVASHTGEIIGTNLYNDVNGFVRYRMTDAAAGTETAPCSACKRPYTPLIAGLDGRQEDYLYSGERGWIPPAIVTYPLKHLHYVQELQFQQNERDAIALHYVLRPGAGQAQATAELNDIQAGLRRLMGQGLRLELRQVDEIPRGRTGKYKWIVSRLDPRG